MAIKTGDKLPTGTLWELIEEETPGCTVGPNAFEVGEQLKASVSLSSGCPALSRQPARPSTYLDS